MATKTTITITEALAELATLQKRIEKKRESVRQYLARQEQLKDPLEREGGSRTYIERERQSIRDLEERIIRIRQNVQAANIANQLTVLGQSRTIAEWLIWRRDIMEGQRKFLASLNLSIQSVRTDAMRKGLAVVAGEGSKPTDVIINVNEAALQSEIELLEELVGTLDGALSLINATTHIEI
ncbi:MAG: hypothetical protein L0210_03335 [Rhodospirillales bacterium]|nr:hypothetical protein [Rhodospirillales bacterium]